MHWTAKENIMTAEMDGSNPRRFLTGRKNPFDVFISTQHKPIVWTDLNLNSLAFTTLDGTYKGSEADVQNTYKEFKPRGLVRFQDKFVCVGSRNSIHFVKFPELDDEDKKV